MADKHGFITVKQHYVEFRMPGFKGSDPTTQAGKTAVEVVKIIRQRLKNMGCGTVEVRDDRLEREPGVFRTIGNKLITGRGWSPRKEDLFSLLGGKDATVEIDGRRAILQGISREDGSGHSFIVRVKHKDNKVVEYWCRTERCGL